ncbi:MAG: ABC transporter permease [Prevotellaceae bacterium]|jgi:ABC-type transport system involved in multi-copper enzyme maturation permease subunit|nr:ABC transporter permease [Prevotellaceae bacterium]
MKKKTHAIFKILFFREIQGAIVDFRFWVVLALCLSIMPLSFYVSVKDYAQRLSDYQQEVQMYRDVTHVGSQMRAEGVHPPSPLSIFSRGIGDKMPYKVITSHKGDYRVYYAQPDSKKGLLGEIDFGFIVAFVLSVLAIVFTFNCISGDKEQGLLRAILANAVYRRQILLAKLAGNYIVFLTPFLLSMLISLMIVHFSGVIPVFSADILPAILLMTGVSLIFLFALFSLGLWISALTASSALSINVLLLVWIVLGLVVPKVSPIISASIYPVESSNVFEVKKSLLRENIFREQRAEESELYEKLRAQFRPGTEGISTDWSDINSAYDEQVAPVRERFDRRIIAETTRLTDDYAMRSSRQTRLTNIINSLSPVGIANNLMAEFSGTGFSEVDNFTRQAAQFQEMVKQEVYDKFIVKEYNSGNSSMSSTMAVEGFDSNKVPVPMLDSYKYLGVGAILQQNLPDIMLLCLYAILFFVCAFFSFLRFDVR